VAQPVETGKYSFKRGIVVLHLGKEYTSLPLPVFVTDALGVTTRQTIACNEVLQNSRLLVFK